MTLKQAFTEWAAIPGNTAMAARNRSTVDDILLKDLGQMDVRELTAFVVRKHMASIADSCDEIKKRKVRSASILVQVLKYAAEKNVCVMPDFDYSIASAKDSYINNSARSLQEVLGREGSGSDMVPDSPKPASSRHSLDVSSDGVDVGMGKYPSRYKPGHVPATKGKKWDEIMSKEKQENCKKGWKNIIEHRAPHSPNSGRKKIPVVQLDPETLQEVSRFEDIASAGRSTGIGNIQRSMNDHKMSGGYYWARPEDVDGFEPGYKRGPKTTTWSRKKKEEETKAVNKQVNTKGSRMSEENEVVGKPVSGGPDKNCPAVGPGKPLDKSASDGGSAMSHGESGTVSQRTPLSFYSDQELKDEFIRRGWTGTLYKRLVI